MLLWLFLLFSIPTAAYRIEYEGNVLPVAHWKEYDQAVNAYDKNNLSVSNNSECCQMKIKTSVTISRIFLVSIQSAEYFLSEHHQWHRLSGC